MKKLLHFTVSGGSAEMKRAAGRFRWALRGSRAPAEAGAAPGDVPVDLRGLPLDPVDALVRAGRVPVVVDVPLAACRGHRAAAFVCVPGAGHPYLETMRALDAAPHLDYEASPLAHYHRSFQPRDAAELLGVERDAPALAGPPEGMVFPWEDPPVPDQALRRRRRLEKENELHGAPLAASHGFHHFGPVSRQKGDLEIARMRRLLARVRGEGFRLLPGSDGLCTASILVAGGEWRALILNGQHRVAVCAALGQSFVPLRPLPGPIRREEVDAWPSVRAGVFDRATALAVFDRIFAGRQPRALDPAYLAVYAAPDRPAATEAIDAPARASA